MELKETSRPNSPFLLNHDQIGHQVNLTLSAVGRAYLAHCSNDKLQILKAQLLATGLPENQMLPNKEKFDAMLETVRQRGYAVRDPSFGGGNPPFRSQYDDGLDAIAVPLPYEGHIIGCVSITWIRTAASSEEISKSYLKNLQATATEIIDFYQQTLLLN
jgi:IclR family mhp operon transcriptional activator